MRIDDGNRRRQLWRRLMMVDDDNIEPHLIRRRDFARVRNAAIHRDDQIYAALLEQLQAFDIQAVPLFDPVRNMVDRLRADLAQERNQHRRAGSAVDVVITPDADLLSVLDCVDDPPHGRFHIGHFER